MKTSDIIKCLKNNKKVDGFEISITSKDSRELFYVLKHLEINRAVKTNKVAIEVYCMDKKTTGSSLFSITAADDVNTLNKKINKALYKAKTAKNKYYPLPKKSKNIVDNKEIKEDLNDIANNIARAIFKADVYTNGWINSTEIFVSKFTNEFINSNGVKHISNSFKIEIECIPTWSNKKEEFELYKYYKANRIDYAKITKEVNEILSLTKDRSCAKTLDKVRLPKNVLVLVKNDMRDLLINNLANDLSYASKYTKVNHYNINDKISNTKFDLIMKPEIRGAVNSKKFDDHGICLKKKTIIKDGDVNNNYGDIKYGYYLGIKNITGNLPAKELKARGIDYCKNKHLIIETFSSPQLEENSGYWGGEVRLARYFDGKKYIPLTGFSISGNIYKDIKNINFSNELDISENYKGPKYLIFKDININ